MANGDIDDLAAGASGASQRVYLGIMRDLELRRMVPGQRLIETELAQHYGVGRNAVREAVQRLSGRGVVDLSPNRSPAIRKLDGPEIFEILDVAAAMTGLVARTAARNFDREMHADALRQSMDELRRLAPGSDVLLFGQARRSFYRALLAIGQNRELQRIFPNIGMHIIYSQFQSHDLLLTRVADYRTIAEAVYARHAQGAETAARKHVENVREFIVRSGHAYD